MNVRPLPESLQLKAQNELNEDPLRIDEDIKHIREWLKKQPHLITRQDDHFILCFLRGCKFSLQKAKEKLDSFYRIRATLPEYFCFRDPFAGDIQMVLNAGGILPLPKLSGPNEYRVILFRWSAFNPQTMPFSLIMKVSYMIIDILMQEDDYLLVSGVHVLVEHKDFPAGYVTQLTPTSVQKSVAMQSGYPLRWKELDIINAPNFLDALYVLIKPVLPSILINRMRIYNEDNADTLYQNISPNILPREYGTCELSLEELKDIWKRKVESYADWFKQDEKYYYDEKMWQGEPKIDAFGAEGSFRKLNID